MYVILVKSNRNIIYTYYTTTINTMQKKVQPNPMNKKHIASDFVHIN